ncbi:hypothetical protein DPMN_097136 [Dreissena polymorpha]|uniref:Uncharacterized protein n=1 Tax=Dreissena polymorpha TaxID=45954 RepID=A0A9D4LCP8_DREPO|nr:hypothetical protein DPMN_097136 [Dreissena polymorpha]
MDRDTEDLDGCMHQSSGEGSEGAEEMNDDRSTGEDTAGLEINTRTLAKCE